MDFADVNKLRGDDPGLFQCSQCNKCSCKRKAEAGESEKDMTTEAEVGEREREKRHTGRHI